MAALRQSEKKDSLRNISYLLLGHVRKVAVPIAGNGSGIAMRRCTKVVIGGRNTE